MVQFAQLDLTHPKQPRSVQFDDIYFSRQGGRAESEHVFLHAQQLTQRWQNHPRPFFTIGETGFGTGLNFLVAWQALKQRQPHLRLHFISTEQYPIHPQQLSTLLAPWQHDLSGTKELLKAYDYLVPGWNRMSFQNAELTLWIGDATAGFEDFNGLIDAWFLDGFSPATNPQLWTPQLFSALAKVSHTDTTFATYTIAGQVREGLSAAGFTWQKQPGFGQKQACLSGRFMGRHGPHNLCHGWPRPCASRNPNIAIIGGGLAAAELTHSAHQRGLDVTVFAPQKHTLGNIQGAVYARPGLEADPNTQWYAQALSYRLRRWQQTGSDWPGAQTGLLQLLPTERWQRMQQNLAQHPFAHLCEAIDAKQASVYAGTPIAQPGLWFPSGGWLSLQDYIDQLCQPARRVNTQIRSLHYNGAQWILTDEQEHHHAFHQVILATGVSTSDWPACQHLPIQSVRGQITAITHSAGPQCVICGDRYVTPNAPAGFWHVGSTFQPNETAVHPKLEDRAANAQALKQLAPHLMRAFHMGTLSDAVGIRAASPDRLPMAGPLVVQTPAAAHRWQWHQLQYQPGLWVMTALGSKGLTSAPLLAEYVISQITGEPLPFGHQQEQRIHAERFWRKANTQP